ncbi:TPA: hypothetical protein EYP38_02010 [Candidatus Micrarchaeota archaeon]|nr:hypothetical protein [Candidatus Micrarchaeota archaeon]
MQTVEAMISLVILVAIISSMLLMLQQPHQLDDSLYKYQLANDAWRVLYLKGNFEGLDDEDELGRILLEEDAAEIKDMTGLCMFLMGTRYTNCRYNASDPSGPHEVLASVKKAIIEGGKHRQITFSVQK